MYTKGPTNGHFLTLTMPASSEGGPVIKEVVILTLCAGDTITHHFIHLIRTILTSVAKNLATSRPHKIMRLVSATASSQMFYPCDALHLDVSPLGFVTRNFSWTKISPIY